MKHSHPDTFFCTFFCAQLLSKKRKTKINKQLNEVCFVTPTGGSGTRQVIGGVKTAGTKQVVVGSGSIKSSATKQVNEL